MQQLSGQDASFIYSERPHAPTHITSISIYDPSTAPSGEVSFTDVLDHFVLSFTACRELMPDPERYADAIEAAFHELADAARVPAAAGRRR